MSVGAEKASLKSERLDYGMAVAKDFSLFPEFLKQLQSATHTHTLHELTGRLCGMGEPQGLLSLHQFAQVTNSAQPLFVSKMSYNLGRNMNPSFLPFVEQYLEGHPSFRNECWGGFCAGAAHSKQGRMLEVLNIPSDGIQKQWADILSLWTREKSSPSLPQHLRKTLPVDKKMLQSLYRLCPLYQQELICTVAHAMVDPAYRLSRQQPQLQRTAGMFLRTHATPMQWANVLDAKAPEGHLVIDTIKGGRFVLSWMHLLPADPVVHERLSSWRKRMITGEGLEHIPRSWRPFSSFTQGDAWRRFEEQFALHNKKEMLEHVGVARDQDTTKQTMRKKM